VKHLHYIVQGYRDTTNEGGVTDAAVVDVIVNHYDEPDVKRKGDNRRASTVDLEQVAIERARNLVDKPHYRVSQVIEKHDGECGVHGAHPSIPGTGGY
jgi:hypothetical protein